MQILIVQDEGYTPYLSMHVQCLHCSILTEGRLLRAPVGGPETVAMAP